MTILPASPAAERNDDRVRSQSTSKRQPEPTFLAEFFPVTRLLDCTCEPSMIEDNTCLVCGRVHIKSKEHEHA